MQAATRAPQQHAAAVPCRARAVRQFAARRTSIRCRAELQPDWSGRQFTLLSTCEDATAQLAALLATERKAGDAYCLKGDAGGGKSAFCQAFVRAATGDASRAVPQPTPSLVPGCHGGEGGPMILHFNLNGLQQPSEADCAELASSFEGAVSLIEWAEQLRSWGAAPEQRLALYFRRVPTNPGSDARLISVVPHTGAWEARVGFLHAHLCREGPAAGLVVLSNKMALEMTAGLPEAELAMASGGLAS